MKDARTNNKKESADVKQRGADITINNENVKRHETVAMELLLRSNNSQHTIVS